VATALLAWAGHWWAVVAYMAVLTALTLVALAFGSETREKNIVEGETDRPTYEPADREHA